MKTRLLVIVGIIMISATVILFSYVDVMQVLSDEHYEIKITGLKNTYTTNEIYSFDYHVTGYGDGCAVITTTYPDKDGKTMKTISEPSCVAERSFEMINASSLHGTLGNIAIKVPGTYEISATYDPIGSILFTTATKQFEVIDEFEKTWGGPGNRHPAFLGFDIPEICTEDMIKHLVKYSSMFEKNTPYSLEWISMDESIDSDDFDICVEELLERNPKELENEN